MRKIIQTTTLVAALGLCVFSAQAESLWSADKAAGTFADKRATKVGDILTIIIVESAVSTQQASTDTKKDSKIETGPGVGPLLERIPFFNYSGGNLQIEGTRLVQTNAEKEEVKLTGTVRAQDVAPDNTVMSTYIADAKITHSGSGPVGSRQREGLIGRIFRILF